MAIGNRDMAVVEAFLLDSLSDEEGVYFESRLSSKDFVMYLEEQKMIQEVIEDKGRLMMKQKLHTLESQYGSNNIRKGNVTRVIPFYKRRIVLAVASGVLLLGAVIGLFNRSNKISNEELFASNYTPYPNLVDPITKGDSESFNAYQLYEQDDYSTAIKELSRMEVSENQQWYLALSHIGNKDYWTAESILDSILSVEDHTYYSPAQWYRALLYLRDNDVDLGEGLLRQITRTSNHPYATKAGLLLKEL